MARLQDNLIQLRVEVLALLSLQKEIGDFLESAQESNLQYQEQYDQVV